MTNLWVRVQTLVQKLGRQFGALSLIQKGMAASLVFLWVLLSSHLWYGDVLFHTDVARDFLVLEEIVQTKNPTLIGPRSGGIPGVFHGPLWYYLSLPVFVMVQGDPVLMGWFWWSLGVVVAAFFFGIAWRESKKFEVSILATACFSLLLLPQSASPVNNYLADLFSFVVFYVWWRWYQKPTLRLAFLGWFGLGLLVQFQMAFAVPVALVWGVFFLLRLWRTKKYRQVLSPLVFLIPLATFLLFELRHDWLQVRSVMQYVKAASSSASLSSRVIEHTVVAVRDGLNMFLLPGWLGGVVLGLFAVYAKRARQKAILVWSRLFCVWYVGWWVLSLGFSGTVWPYYYTPFLGVLLFGVALLASHSRAAKWLLMAGTVWLFIHARSSWWYSPERFNASSWVLLQQIAHESLSEPNRGYFLYSQDQFANSLKYAFSYYAARHPEVQAHAFSKQESTVVVKSADNPDNPYSTSEGWLRDKIRITQPPVSTRTYSYGYIQEVYELDETARQVPIDPNLILNLHFR